MGRYNRYVDRGARAERIKEEIFERYRKMQRLAKAQELLERVISDWDHKLEPELKDIIKTFLEDKND